MWAFARFSVACSYLLCSVLVLTMALAATHVHAAQSWQYCVNEDVRPVAQSIVLSDERPDDLDVDVSFRGQQQRYAQLRYGSENSRRVTVVVDDIGDGVFAFYVDTDRDREIVASELVPGAGRVRLCGLDTEIIHEDEPVQAARQVRLRLNATGKRLNVATLGYIEGSLRWSGDESQVTVRRIDANANGLFADARDRLMMDLDRDGKWHRIKEQFAYLPVLKIGDRRFAVRSDRLGERFSLEEIKGVGNLRIVAAGLPKQAKVVGFEAMVFSEDGAAYALRNMNEPLSVPVGRYTLGSVTMTIDTGEREPWHFVFSRSGSISEERWIRVDIDANVSIEAVGQARFDLETREKVVARPGDALAISPRLYTEDGLLINLSARGKQMGSFDLGRAHNCCKIELQSSSGTTVAATKSGFA